ncbi:rhomboid family intramembrane serine protease [Crocinitomix sp.]|nr:rhomboid family intramembrane serine protease [Crocinitomix sp.]
MAKESIGQYIKRLIKQSGLVGKLIAINTVVFLFFIIIRLIAKLYVNDAIFGTTLSYFAAISEPSQIIYKPWTLITHLFTHYEFLHFLLNMLVLYFSARIFVHFFGERRLLSTYLLGGVFAYIVHAGAYYVFPLLQNEGPSILVGASASIMAVFFAVAVHEPSFKVKLFGVFDVPLLAIAGIFLLSDLMGLGQPKDEAASVAHFAHIGGAIFGTLSVINANSSKNFMNRLDRFFIRFKLPKITIKSQPKMKVYRGETKAAKMTDEEYNAQKVARQKRVDAILDKIAKKGYDGLTKEEKDILFKESKK